MSSFKNLSTAKSAVYAKNGDIWYDVNAKVFKAKANNAIFVLGQSIIDETVLQQINDNIELKLNKDNSNALYSAVDSNFTKIELVNPLNNAKALFNFDDIATVNYVNSQISQALSAFQDNRLEFNTFNDFPDVGDTTKFYVDLQEDKVYIWDDSSDAYKLQTWDTAAISALQASIANLETTKLNKSTYNGTAQNLKNDIDGKANISHTHDISNVTNLQPTLNNKLDKGTYVGNAQDLKNDIDGKANISHTHDISNVTNLQPTLDGKESTISAGTTGQYWRGDKTWQTLDKSAVGLSNADNTSDANKPISNATQSALNAKADLVDGKVPSSQLPSYIDDVLEFANLASFPATGESGKIYIALDTNKTYRWRGTGYAEISASLALGETSETAYRGDRGKTAYEHSQTIGNPHGTTKADIGLGNVNNTSDLDKPISNATQTALDLKADLSVINNLQIGGRNLITKLHKEKSYPAIGFWEYFPLSEKLKEGETYILNGTVENVGGAISIGLNNFEGYNVYVITLPINTPFVANNEMANRTHFSIANQTGVGTSIFKSFKLEKGNKATDWTPAPEDKQDRLQDITGYIGVGKTDASATEKLDVNGNVKATSFKTSGGTPSQFLKADGSVDSNTYAKSWENAYSIGFSNGEVPTNSGSQYPYVLHNAGGGYIPLATQNYVINNYIRVTHPIYNITQSNINDWLSYRVYSDTRQIQPSHLSVKTLQFGFTSWDNNNSAPWGDYLHFGGYQDNSGGNQNLIIFKKNGFGLRQFQGSSQGVSTYSSFVDYWHSGNLNPNDYATKNTPVFNNKIVIRDNSIEEIATNNTSEVAINYAGYNLGNSQYRNLVIYDGKGNNVAIFNGQNKSLNLVGALTANSIKKSGGTATQILMANGDVIEKSTISNQTLSTSIDNNGRYLSISGGNQISIDSRLVHVLDSPNRNPNDPIFYPNVTGKSVRFDFISAGHVTGTGNYAGLMTFSPWDGTTNSTGDSSYQLAFYNQTGINGSGIPGLKIRKGIDTTWNSWYKIYTTGDFTQSNIDNWNAAHSWGSHVDAWNAASLSYSGSTLTLTINGISKTATINAGANYTAGTNITISGNTISVAASPTFSGTVTASGFYESSLRELKEHILPFELSGLGLLSQLEIVTYDRIDKSSVNKIGIIADDSPQEFLSEEKDAVDLYKTVFIQSKAIQELNAKNLELEERLIKLKKLLSNG
jgi:hypothetical protein